MKGWRQVVAAASIGIFVGAASVTRAMAATSKSPAYLVVEYEITDRDAFQAYIKGVESLPTTRVFLARHAKGISLSGEPPKWIGILKYPSLEEALAFENSTQYKALVSARDKGTKWRAYVVEGLPEQAERQ